MRPTGLQDAKDHPALGSYAPVLFRSTKWVWVLLKAVVVAGRSGHGMNNWWDLPMIDPRSRKPRRTLRDHR